LTGAKQQGTIGRELFRSLEASNPYQLSREFAYQESRRMKWILTTACAVLFTASAALAADVPDLLKQLKDGDVEARRAAAKELSEKGPEAKTAVPGLVAALKDKDLFVRRFAAQTLGEIGPDASATATPALKALLSDPKREVVEAAATALGKMGPSGVATLTDLVKEKGKDMDLKKKAIEALGKLGEDGKPAVPVLTGLIADKDLRIPAITALGDLGAVANDKDTVTALQNAAAEKDRNLRMAAQAALRKVQGKTK
jgi:HEAT repeat protein